MSRDSIYRAANGLGFTFANTGEAQYTLSPEMFIVAVAERGQDLLNVDARLYSLTRTWVRSNSHFLRPDGIVASSRDMRPDTLPFLLSICFIAQEFDPAPRRWDGLINNLSRSTRGGLDYIYPRDYPLDRADEYLYRAGIYYKRVAFQDERKFRELRWVVERNPWIKNRVLMTVSARADIYTYLSIHSDVKERKVCEELGVGKSSFYSIKKNLELINIAHR